MLVLTATTGWVMTAAAGLLVVGVKVMVSVFSYATVRKCCFFLGK